MLLASIQTELAKLYETPIAHQVGDFLITSARLAGLLEGSSAPRTNAERVLLQQSSEGLEMSLYIDQAVLDNLVLRDPYTELNGGNLNDFLIAVEGVSHFNYIIWNALHERQITQLELELQAEVDKFVTAMMMLDEQGANSNAHGVHNALFKSVLFADPADSVCGRRYRDANHYAGKYCQHLTQKFPTHHRAPSFMNEIRRFYRLPQNQKIRVIDLH
jgi:hypothetical protein